MEEPSDILKLRLNSGNTAWSVVRFVSKAGNEWSLGGKLFIKHSCDLVKRHQRSFPRCSTTSQPQPHNRVLDMNTKCVVCYGLGFVRYWLKQNEGGVHLYRILSLTKLFYPPKWRVLKTYKSCKLINTEFNKLKVCFVQKIALLNDVENGNDGNARQRIFFAY